MVGDAIGVLAGVGAGAIDAGLNTYAATHFSERAMQWLHASYGVGITLGPLIMITTLANLNSWRAGYILVGSFQLLLALGFALTLRLWTDGAPTVANTSEPLPADPAALGETLCQIKVWISILLFLLYAGAETALGVWAYSLLTEARHVAPTLAGLITGSYWAAFTGGRIIAGLYAKPLGVDRLIQGSLICAMLGALLLSWDSLAAISPVAVALIGLAVAPIFPALVSGTRQRVGGRFVANVIGLQMGAAGLGAALMPGLMGILANRTSLEAIPIALFLLFASLFGLYRLALGLRSSRLLAH